jgi:c-di-GMP-binding flagellar brake protein YcgR
MAMTEEKRKHKRAPIPVEVLWEGAISNQPARTTDISEGGCFIDTMGGAAAGETINFKLLLPDGEWIAVQGEVVYELPHTGFGVRFTSITDSDRERLMALLATVE